MTSSYVLNGLSEELQVRLQVGERLIAPTLPVDSFNTFLMHS